MCQRVAFAVLWVLLGAFSTPARSAVLRVKPGAPGPAHDGATWPTAFPNVLAALNAATAGDEVWVAAGVYKGSLTLKPGVSLYGGFAGDEAERGARDPRAHLSVLDGDNRGRVILALAGVGQDTVLDGFTIRGGVAQDGGGIGCSDASPTIANNVITGNRAVHGGGVMLSHSNAILRDNVIESNTATLEGAGIRAGNESLPLIERCRVLRNVCDSAGGGLFTMGATVTVRNSLFVENVASVGSAMKANGANDRPLVVNNTFVGNRTTPGFGARPAVYCYDWGGVLVNNIVAFNDVGIRWIGEARNNDVYGNTVAAAEETTVYRDGRYGNISADPLFVDSATGDYRLQPASPARDAGDDAAVLPDERDLDGGARIQSGRVDMGAYEAASAPPAFPDALKALRVCVGLLTLAPEDRMALDVDANRRVELTDALSLLRLAMAGPE